MYVSLHPDNKLIYFYVLKIPKIIRRRQVYFNNMYNRGIDNIINKVFMWKE